MVLIPGKRHSAARRVIALNKMKQKKEDPLKELNQEVSSVLNEVKAKLCHSGENLHPFVREFFRKILDKEGIMSWSKLITYIEKIGWTSVVNVYSDAIGEVVDEPKVY